MEPSSRPPAQPATETSEPVLKAAREVWALACWAALRVTWKEWEKSRGAAANKRGALLKLPPLVERFFGLYCHEKYVKWTPFVVAETVTRSKRQRDQRQKKASKQDEEAASLQDQWAKLELTSGEEAATEPVIQHEELARSEELESVLVEERDGLAGDDDEAADPGFDDTDWQSSSGLNLPPLDFSALHIEVPSRPHDPEDRMVWEAWHRTLTELLTPTVQKRRVLMNELFKQATNPDKKTGTAEEVLRCLTGYLKAITREAVRREAREKRVVISNAKVGSMDAPVPGSDVSRSFTGGDVMAGSTSTSDSAAARELEALGEGLARREFARLHDTPGVKLGHFTATLRKEKGRAGDKGFTVGIQDPAILITLGYKPASHHLYDEIKGSQNKLRLAAMACAPGDGDEVQCAIEAYARQELMRLCTEWFWSEEISRDLFSTVMALIHADKDPTFACPHSARCTTTPATVDRPRCWQCLRK